MSEPVYVQIDIRVLARWVAIMRMLIAALRDSEAERSAERLYILAEEIVKYAPDDLGDGA